MKELTVNEIMKKKGLLLHKGKINIIVAPAGSGKTYYIFNTLLDPTKKSVYLCDTSNLKEATLRDKEFADKVKGTDFKLIDGFYMDKYNCTVMTYAKWFYEMNKPEYSDVETIVCDEIHNLYKYKDKFDKEANEEKGIKECKNYESVINNLHANAKKGIQVVGFTATHDRIKREMDFLLPMNDTNITSAFNGEWNVINLSNEKNIKRLKADFTCCFYNYRNLGHYLKAYNGFRYGKKALIYTNRITECKDMINICKEIGLKSIALWSTNNIKVPMNKEQLRVRESILTDCIIPEGYQVLIINGAYETGINILDEDIEIMVCNDTQPDTQIQSRSRIRKNIKLELFKSKECIDDIRIVVPSEFLNKTLTTKDKRELCNIVKVYGEKKNILKWTRIKQIILNSGYYVNEHTISLKKKNDTRVSTITDINPEARIIR